MGKKLTEEQKLENAKKREEKKIQEKEAEEKARIASNRKMELEKLRSSPIPLPRYSYSVGQELSPRTAFWNSLIVKEVLDEGRILLCEINSTNNNYGNPVPVKETRYISHLEVIPKDLKCESDFSPKSRYTIGFHNRDVYGLLNQHYGFGVDFSPVYQRELCWTLENKQALIHSIFSGVEIGKFAFISLPYKKDGPGCEVLDGKQRLSTLIDFYEDKFQYKGKYFSELSRQDKQHFLHYHVTFGEAREDMTMAEKLEYFLRLNTTGVPQSEAHMNKVAEMLKKEQS